MPTYFCENTPAYYRALKKARAKATAELVAKGMIPGHGKFNEVVERNVRTKRRFWQD